LSGLRADRRGARFAEGLPERWALPLPQLLALVSSLHLERPDLGLRRILSLRNLPLQCQELVPSRVRLSLRRPYGRQCTLDTFYERRRELLRRCGVAGVLPLL